MEDNNNKTTITIGVYTNNLYCFGYNNNLITNNTDNHNNNHDNDNGSGLYDATIISDVDFTVPSISEEEEGLCDL